MKFAPRSLLIPLLLAGVAAPLAAFPAAADPGGSGHQAPPVVGAGDGPADKEAVSVVRPGADGKVTQVPVGGARLTGYDATGGHAVLTGARASDGAGSGAGTPAQLRVGDVIASPVTAVTPHGALVKVTATHPGAGGSVTVDTAPADLTEALGDAKADVRTPLTAADLKTKPLTQGGHVSAGPSDGQGIRLDVDVPVPPGVKPTAGHSSALSGHLDLKPEMLFSYERAHWYSVQPSKAEIGLSADYTYEVKAHAEGSASYDTGRKPLRIPAAEVDVDKTVWLGPVPIVLTMKVDYFYDVSADGKISVDAEQRSTGRLEAGARYDADKGWSALSGPEPATTGTPARVEGSATAKAGIGTHAQLGLYGSVGVAADFMPYLKATAHGVAGDGSAPRDGTPKTGPAKTDLAKADAPQGVNGDWAVYAGADLTGSFFAKLAVFGVKVLDHTWEFPKVTYEHKLAGSDS